MFAIDENTRLAIDNARALLDTLLSGGWSQICVTGNHGDYFLAREAGTANPLLNAQSSAEPLGEPTPTLDADASILGVSAPHVGTVAWLAPLGTLVSEGEVLARLAVLDELIDIPAPAMGTVSALLVEVDDLAEFSTLLLELVS